MPEITPDLLIGLVLLWTAIGFGAGFIVGIEYAKGVVAKAQED